MHTLLTHDTGLTCMHQTEALHCSCYYLAGAGPAAAMGSAAEDAEEAEIQATGEFDLGEEQPGEGGEGFMDLGASIDNKVTQHSQPDFPRAHGVHV